MALAKGETMGVAFIGRNQFFTDSIRIQVEEIRLGHRTTLKVQTACVPQKIYFPELRQKIRAVQVQESDALLQLIFNEIATGHAVVTEKRKDGKLNVFATQEVANQLAAGTLTLTGKKGKVKEIGEITVVGLQFFLQLVQKLPKAAETKKEAVKEVAIVKTPTRSIKVDTSVATKILLTLVCKAETAEQFVAEEKSRIIDRNFEENREAREISWEVLRQDIKRSERRREVLKSEIERQDSRLHAVSVS